MISYIVYALINMTRATFTHVFLYEMFGNVKENREERHHSKRCAQHSATPPVAVFCTYRQH